MGITSELIGLAPDESVKFSNLDDQQKIATMVSRVNDFFQFFEINIRSGKEDYDFLMQENQQWDPELLSARQNSKQPTFQINYIYSIVTSLLGKIRQNTPEFKIYSDVDESNAKVKIDQEGIDIRENYLRQISYENNAPIQYQMCAENQLGRGYGALSIYLEYENEFSFKQKIKIKSIDPSWCFWDTSDNSLCKTDSRYYGYLEQFTYEEFKENWPDSKSVKNKNKPSSFPSMTLSKNMDYLWQGEDYISICNYFVKESHPIILYQMNNGIGMTLTQAEKEIEIDRQKRKKAKVAENLIKKTIMKISGKKQNQEFSLEKILPLDFAYDDKGKKITRNSLEYKIIHYVATKTEILEQSEWPSHLNGLIFVDGHSWWKDGQQYTKSFHKTAKDPQRIANMMMSESVGNLINSHKSQWLGTPENFNGYEHIWRDPSIPKGALIAKRDEMGQMPIQIQPPQISPNYAPLITQSISDIQNCMGFVNPSQKESDSEISGKAYNSRVRQSELSSFIYLDNLSEAIAQANKVMLSLMPFILDTKQSIMVRDKNNQQRIEDINVPTADGIKNDMTAGKFNVEVTIGNDYQTQKSENLDQLLQLTSIIAPINPPAASLMMDLIAANTNLTNTPQIVDRLRAAMLGMNPSDILKHEMGIPAQKQQQQNGPDPAQMQIEIQKMQLQNESEKIKVEQQKIQMESQKLQVEHEKNLIDRQKSLDAVKMKELEVKREEIAANAEISKNLVVQKE
jgi:hypothetical protein